jgi:multidrug transporter EmrE-like cation transporter
MEPRALLLLALAIAAEIFATSSLKASEGFTRLRPSVQVAIGYGVAFYCLSLALRSIPIGVAYAIWSGVGTAVVAVIGWALFEERLSPAQVGGIALIVLGTVLLQVSGGKALAG